MAGAERVLATVGADQASSPPRSRPRPPSFHVDAAAAGGTADGGAQAACTLTLDERHPHGLSGLDLAQQRDHGWIGRARLLLAQPQSNSSSEKGSKDLDLHGHNGLLVVAMSRGGKPIR